MIEVLLALAIGVIIIAGISKAVNTSLSNSQFSKNQSSANQYAQEGMEIVKNLKPTPGSYCLAKGKTALIIPDDVEDLNTGCPQNVDVFAREVYVQNYACDCGSSYRDPDKNVRKVTVSVGWSDSKCTVPPTSTPTPIPAPTKGESPGNAAVTDVNVCNSSRTISNLSSFYCHRVQLVSCLSDPDVIRAP